jgi:hypothetical protein
MALELTRKSTAHTDLLLSQLIETIRFACAERSRSETQRNEELGMQFGPVMNDAIKNVDARELDQNLGTWASRSIVALSRK